MQYSFLKLHIFGDNHGSLVAIESLKNIPFEIKRVYYIFGTAEHAVRGKHAHHKLEQLIICLAGSCDFLLDDGHSRVTVHLNDPTKGLYIKNNIWREFTNFSKDCVIVVLASDYYDESDYIKNYNNFLNLSGK